MALLFLAAAVSCEARDAAPPAPVVTDSGGVRIVRPGPAFKPPVWSAAALPRLDLVRPGSAPGRPHPAGDTATFSRIRGIVHQSDGDLVVADDGGVRIVWLSREGVLRASSGSTLPDSGFSSVWPVGLLPGDSLVVSDDVMSRLAVFDPIGRLAWSRRVDRGGAATTPWDVLPDGSLLVTTRREASALPGAGAVRDTLVLWSFDMQSGERRQILRLQGIARVSIGGASMPVPWTGNPVFTADSDGILVAAGDGFTVERWSLSGRLLSREFDGREPTRITASMKARYLEAELRNLADSAIVATRLRELRAMPLPPTSLAFARLLVAEDGRVWARDYEWAREGPALWTVFDRETGVLARVRTPPGLEIMCITRDAIVGVAREGTGERVRIYPIER